MKNIFNCFKINKKFISEVDRFLIQFDQQNPKKSQSQQSEISEYQTLFQHRDFADKAKPPI
jgi:hypothetical protein